MEAEVLSKNEELLKRALYRERQARFKAEDILEKKTKELYVVVEHLKKQITDRIEAEKVIKRNQAQMIQSEKMAGLGQLAAGVAHEINNPVGFVTSNLQTLKKYSLSIKKMISEYDSLVSSVQSKDIEKSVSFLTELAKTKEKEDIAYILDDLDNLVKESIDGTNRVKEIVKGLKSFARLDEAEMKEADINEGIESTLKIVWNEIKYKCEVIKKLSPLPMIVCFPGQLNQVFMNLIVNAAQAIQEKGTLTIESFVEKEDIVIRFTDTGSGIKPENLEKLFNPFFTTKAVGKGTGLGLSVSYGIIKKHKGDIFVESQVGVGTTFTIKLPMKGAAL
ncbi:MAG: hypothetical protein IPJ69_10695 [Deltaproteobacteria bacterium]|nr:MAG: hypothetical protein IPJ69_10695 [Deltaproteobacteria bacterium]